MKANDPVLIQDHFRKLRALQKNYDITDCNIYNMDEKGFKQGISDRAKVICLRRPKGMTGKVAMDGERELITMVETISGDGIVLPPLVIYKGAGYYMGWYQHIEKLGCEEWRFAYSPKGWTSSYLSLEWLKHFDDFTAQRNKNSAYRCLIVDSHGSHVTIEFIEYALSHNIIVYYLPSHSTHLLQPLDIELFSPLQKA